MPLSTADIAFWPGDSLTDGPNGGGPPRYWPIPSGVVNNLFGGVVAPAETVGGSLSIRKLFAGVVAGATSGFQSAYAYILAPTGDTATDYASTLSDQTQHVLFSHGARSATRGGTAPMGALGALVTRGQWTRKPNERDMTTIASVTGGEVTLVSGDLTIAVGDMLQFFGASGVHGVARVYTIVGTGVDAFGVATTTITFDSLSPTYVRSDTLCARYEAVPAPHLLPSDYFSSRGLTEPVRAVGAAAVMGVSGSRVQVAPTALIRMVVPQFEANGPNQIPSGVSTNVLPEWSGHVPIFRRGGRVLVRDPSGAGEIRLVTDVSWDGYITLSSNLLGTYGPGATIHGLLRIGDTSGPGTAVEALWVTRAIQRQPTPGGPGGPVVLPGYAGSVTVGVRDYGDPFGTEAAVVLPWDDSATPGGQGAGAPPPPPSGDLPMPTISPDGVIPAPSAPYVHTLAVTIDATGVPLPVSTVSMAIEDGSVCWTLTATGRPSLYAMFAESTTPQIVRVEIDNIDWLFIVESASRTRRGAPESSVTIVGRSAAMVAGEPYALPHHWVNEGEILARDLCTNAQSGTGITVAWHVLDWRISDKVLTFIGSALALVQRVGEAIGAVVLCGRADNTLYVIPRYPRMPADWGTAAPNVTIAEEAIRSDAFTRTDKPAYNSVWVSGQQQGVLGQVYLAGTNGSAQAPLVTDLLITDMPAVLQRGRSVLGAAGPQASITMTLPIATGAGQPGVLSPGQLVDVGGVWRGVVRSVVVNVALPAAEQTVVVERHL